MYPHGICFDFEAGRIVDTERSYLDQNEVGQYHHQVLTEQSHSHTPFPPPLDYATSTENVLSHIGSGLQPWTDLSSWNLQQPVHAHNMPLEVALGNPTSLETNDLQFYRWIPDEGGLSLVGPGTSSPPGGHMMAPRTPSPPPFWLSPPSLTPASTDASSSPLLTPESSTMAGSQLPIYIRQQGSPTCAVESDRVGRGRVQKNLRASAAKQKEVAAATARTKCTPHPRKKVGGDCENTTTVGSGPKAKPGRRRTFTSKFEDIRGYQFFSPSDHPFQCQWNGTCGVYFRNEEHLRQHLRADPLAQGGHGLLLDKASNGETVCLWEGCGALIAASNRRRHIDAEHLGARMQCVQCEKVLIRVQSPIPKCKNGGTCEYKKVNFIRSFFNSPLLDFRLPTLSSSSGFFNACPFAVFESRKLATFFHILKRNGFL